MGRIMLAVFFVVAPCPHAADAVHGALDADHAFDEGSRICLGQLTPVQVANLTTLAQAWGFLKYHHSSVTAGADAIHPS